MSPTLPSASNLTMDTIPPFPHHYPTNSNLYAIQPLLYLCRVSPYYVRLMWTKQHHMVRHWKKNQSKNKLFNANFTLELKQVMFGDWHKFNVNEGVAKRSICLFLSADKYGMYRFVCSSFFLKINFNIFIFKNIRSLVFIKRSINEDYLMCD